MRRLLQQFLQLKIAVEQKAALELFSLWTEINLTLNRSEIKKQRQTLMDLGKADEKALEQALTDKNPMVRLTAIQEISKRRLPLERDLIERLLDEQPLIRTAARQALIRLARGLDFGPKAGAARLEHFQAVQRWRHWLAMQQSDGPETALQDPVPANPDADRLVVELVQAKKEREAELLQSLRTAPEPQGTLVLAAAIRELKTPRQAKVRQTLAGRLADQDVSQLKKRFTDEDAEVRHAAVTAAGLKKDKGLIPDVLKLLEDPDAAVAQEARATLKLLTGRDFGPAANASPLDRSIAIGQWYGWWLKEKKGE
jgi:HEAT repeat protein